MLTYNVMNDFGKLVDLFFDSPAINREYPRVEVVRNEDEIKINAVIPGVKKDDLSITLEDDRLILEGEKKSDYVEAAYIRKERAFGSFRRAIKLPYRVESDKIEAKLENGILTVLLQRSEETKPKKITIG